ncbi:MAG: M20 family metallopeptidase [Paracoccaceae bacterium]|nr:M20 family metallopeptidase [Paracoccaceae bacterium]
MPLITEHLTDEMIAWRQDFHRHPELGFDEHRTSARVADLLESFGLEVHRGIGGTGVVGVLQRGNEPRSIGLRADMDALPIREANGFAHRSETDGVMHACGHDGHTTMLLGAAKHLAERGNFNGRAVFIFQPAEEHGKGGPAMIADGLFENFAVDAVYGIHNMPGMAEGSFALRTGAMMASEALFEIRIQGQGGHAAMPHHGADALVVGAEIVTALQTIVSRKLNPGINGVVSVTEFKTDGQRNVLPGRAVLKGDARALNRDVNARIEQKMRQIVEGVCLAHGVTAEVSYDTVFEVTVNAAEPTARAAKAAIALAGAEHVNTDCAPILGSEDFAHMALARPGCFLFLGNGTEGPHARPLHSADYDFNDRNLATGAAFWVQLVEQELSEQLA